jgi:Raf kinase inhibitor-like YbhB/YbcL family protein
VANLVRFLLSDQGQWINGQLLYSNGGFPKGQLPVQGCKIAHVFIVKSPAFDDGEEIAQKYGKKIQNVSPPLEWDGAPDGTRSFALACVDIHPIARGYVHWLVADLSPQLSSLPEGAAGSSNPDFTEVKAYAGPFPPSGTHDYEFTLYALLTDTLGVRPGATLQEFRQAAEQNSLAAATLIGKFTKIR